MARVSSMFQAAALLLLATAELGAAGRTYKVKAGEKIQPVLDKAKAGDCVEVGKGRYEEQLVLKISGVTLRGDKGAMLVMPETPVDNPCTGLAVQFDPTGPPLQAGICVAGEGVVLGDPKPGDPHRTLASVTKRVEGVTVQGFTVDSFSGVDIAVLGAKNTVVRDNSVTGTPGVTQTSYGMLTVGSINTKIYRNTARPVGFIGICMDDVSDVHVTDNYVTDAFIGLCVQTNGADVARNKVETCIGAYVDPGIKGAVLKANTIGPTGEYCAQVAPAIGPFGSFIQGIVVDGAIDTVIESNTIKGISDAGVPGNENNHASGVFLTETATGSRVRYNKFKKNEVDIFEGILGTNFFSRNQCKTAIVGVDSTTVVDCDTLQS